ncbi:MAG: hypothetical protein IJP03_05965 [Christensenellaceae bacterium]|nr:hypothetical protein [Christensenellaceae bacterium]
MKKVLSLLLCLLFCMTACGAPSVLEEDAATPLLAVDGKTIMTVEDFSRICTEQQVSADVRGTDTVSEKDLFIKAAEQRILARFAEIYQVDEPADELMDEFDRHMEEIADTEVYGAELAYSEKLQQQLKLDDAAYKAWTVEENRIARSAENLLADIAGEYKTLIDPIEMEEAILRNLEMLLDMYDVRVYYPGLAEEKRSFQTVLN